MRSYPEVLYPPSFEELKQSRPNIKDIYGVDIPVSTASTPLFYLGILIGSYLVTLILSLAVGAIITYMVLPIFNSFTSENEYRLGEYGAYVIFSIIYIICVFAAFRFFMADDKNARIIYQHDLENYNQLSHKVQSHTFILSYKHEKLREIVESNTVLFNHSSAAVGFSEIKFFNYLQSEFDLILAKHFTRNRSVQFNDTEILDEDIRLYTPDIIYTDPNLKFKVDIEIDEPYVIGSDEPIHYIFKNGTSKDDHRDQTFLKNNWVVIKFSEYQVTKEPKACIDYIHSVIQSIYSLTLDTPNSDLFSQPRWHELDARAYAATRFRERYLKTTFTIKKPL